MIFVGHVYPHNLQCQWSNGWLDEETDMDILMQGYLLTLQVGRIKLGSHLDKTK